MLYDNEKPSTTDSWSIRNQRHPPLLSTKGAKPAGYWVSKKSIQFTFFVFVLWYLSDLYLKEK